MRTPSQKKSEIGQCAAGFAILAIISTLYFVMNFSLWDAVFQGSFLCSPIIIGGYLYDIFQADKLSDPRTRNPTNIHKRYVRIPNSRRSTVPIRQQHCDTPSMPDQNMDGIGYEHFCADILRSNGWSVSVTQASSDQGADLIAYCSEDVLVVQCKRFKGSVGNAAVQQVVAARAHYNGTKCVVVSTGTFTRSARELAASNKVELLHHDELRYL